MLKELVERVKGFLTGQGRTRPVDRGLIEKSVKHWNKQPFPQSKLGYPLKPKTSQFKTLGRNKFPTVKQYRPVYNKLVEKPLLTLVKIKGVDKAGKKREFTTMLGHEKLITRGQLEKEAWKNVKQLIKSGDIPEEYEVKPTAIMPLIGFINIAYVEDEYPDIIDELNPAYFE